MPLLKALPCSYWEKTQQVTKLGTPDILGCLSGMFVALELKNYGENPTELQMFNLKMIYKAKGLSFCMDQSNYQEIIFSLLNDSFKVQRKRSIDNLNSFC